MTRPFWVLTFCVAFCSYASAGAISVTGTISQSTQDGTGPAANNPSLNNILDTDGYTILLDFTGSGVSGISGPGVYDLTGGSLMFLDATASALEASFGSITLVVTNVSVVDDLTLFACLTTGTACNQGNQLSASFEIAAASLNAANVSTTGLDQPHPLDLLEDDGATDIQGSITKYSYTGASAVPEPGSAFLVIAGLAILAVSCTEGKQKSTTRRNLK